MARRLAWSESLTKLTSIGNTDTQPWANAAPLVVEYREGQDDQIFSFFLYRESLSANHPFQDRATHCQMVSDVCSDHVAMRGQGCAL